MVSWAYQGSVEEWVWVEVVVHVGWGRSPVGVGCFGGMDGRIKAPSGGAVARACPLGAGRRGEHRVAARGVIGEWACLPGGGGLLPM